MIAKLCIRAGLLFGTPEPIADVLLVNSCTQSMLLPHQSRVAERHAATGLELVRYYLRALLLAVWQSFRTAESDEDNPATLDDPDLYWSRPLREVLRGLRPEPPKPFPGVVFLARSSVLGRKVQRTSKPHRVRMNWGTEWPAAAAASTIWACSASVSVTVTERRSSAITCSGLDGKVRPCISPARNPSRQTTPSSHVGRNGEVGLPRLRFQLQEHRCHPDRSDQPCLSFAWRRASTRQALT